MNITEIKTVRLISREKPFYLYHGGSLRSHTLYANKDSLNNLNFKQMDCNQMDLEIEVRNILHERPKVKPEIITIIVDENYKFIDEVA